MNILILHGPNLNMIGKMASYQGKQITLDKINSELRHKVRNQDIQLKMIQTHKVFQAINFIQRNRNWADALVLAPMAWARYEYAVLEALQISKIKTIQVLFSEGYSNVSESDSIFSTICYSTIVGPPDGIYLDALEAIINSD